MIKFCKEQWAKNEDTLRKALMSDKLVDDCDYGYLVKLVVEHILNVNDIDEEWDFKNITTIDNGDYQGTQLYLIPRNTYQPAEYDYLMTHAGYGSCSGCDTLQYIQYDCSDDKRVDEYMNLCRDLVCNIIKPHNSGWRNEEIYEIVEK